MNPDEKSKYTINDPNISDLTFKRYDSFISKMSLIGNKIFQTNTNRPQPPPVIIPQERPAHTYRVHEETHSNVFRGFRKQEPEKINEIKETQQQDYERQCLEYEKYLFDSRIKMILKRMAIKAYNICKNEKEGQFFCFPIQRLLVTISKKLLLNRFQLFFLQYVFEQTKWRYDSDSIRKHADHFRSYLMLSDSESGNFQVKLMELYILYCAYFSKKSLNQLSGDNVFLTFCQQHCPKFKQLFPEWTQNDGLGARINPKQMNNIFKKLTFSYDRSQEELSNYCLVVQQILDISPAYNADKNKKQKPRKKRENKNKEQQSLKSEEREDHQRLPDFIQQDSIDIGPVPSFKNKKSSVLSIQMMQPAHYLRSLGSHQRK